MSARKVIVEAKAPLLGPIIAERIDRISEYKRRKARTQQKRLNEIDASSYLAEGWTVRRKLAKGKIVLEKLKPHDEILESRFWCVLYQLGFEELSRGRQFEVQLVSNGKLINRHIAVFAKLGDTIVIANCFSSSRKQSKSLTKEIQDLASLQRPISNAVRAFYGKDLKAKIVWLFVTSNIVWSGPDRDKAAANNIQVIEERELRYFEEIAKNVGPAAKYQFIGEFLSNQRIPSLANYSVPAIRTKLGGNRAYYFLAPAERILPVAFVNHRGLRDVDGAPAYQRILKRSRIRDIGSYIDGGGYFPNSILVNFRESVRFDRQMNSDDGQITFGRLYLPDRFKSVWIVDGQHRLYGYTEANSATGARSIVPIMAFEKLSNKDEAELFSTINSKQQKVGRGLLDELAGELKLESEDFNERTSAIVSRALDMMATETGNPFEDRIRTPEMTDNETVSLTISEIKKAIVSARLLGAAPRNGDEIPGPFSGSSTTESLHSLCDGLSAYFSLIESANQERWEKGRSGYLCSNIAVQGYIRLLAALIEYWKEKTKKIPENLEASELVEKIEPYLRPVLEFVETADDDEFVKRFKHVFGSGGPPRYFIQLVLLVQTRFPDFSPTGSAELLVEQRSEDAEEADAIVKDIVDRVHNHVVATLKAHYGNTEYFDKGVPIKEIKLSALAKKYDDADTSMPPENYLDVVDLKRIVEHKQNWEIFKDTMNIKLPEEKKGTAKYTKWLDRLNVVRPIAAHPFGRQYTESDQDYFDFIDEQLEANGV